MVRSRAKRKQKRQLEEKSNTIGPENRTHFCKIILLRLRKKKSRAPKTRSPLHGGHSRGQRRGSRYFCCFIFCFFVCSGETRLLSDSNDSSWLHWRRDTNMALVYVECIRTRVHVLGKSSDEEVAALKEINKKGVQEQGFLLHGCTNLGRRSDGWVPRNINEVILHKPCDI